MTEQVHQVDSRPANLVPLADWKRADFAASGDSAFFEHHDSRRLTAEEQLLVDKYVRVRLYSGAHGTDPEHYLRTEATFDEIDPRHTTLLFENVGYSLVGEHIMREEARTATIAQRMRRQRFAVQSSRNSVGENYMSSLNAFFYAQNFCIANGYDVRFADIDAWERQHWETAIKSMDDAENDPMLSELKQDFLDTKWLGLPFMEAVAEYTRLGHKSTEMIRRPDGPPEVALRWGQLHTIRETAVASKVRDLALQKAGELSAAAPSDPTNPADKHIIAVFFGAAHRSGIVKRLLDIGVNCDPVSLTDDDFGSVASDLPIDGGNAQAFMSEFLGHNLYKLYSDQYQSPDPNSPNYFGKLQAIHTAVSHAFSTMPLGALAEFYESYRNYQVWFTGADGSEPKTVLAKALAAERRGRENPLAIFDGLVSTVCTRYGVSLAGVLNELEFKATQSKQKLMSGNCA